MQLLIACSTFALSVALAIKRPALSSTLRVSPASAALAGVFCLLITGTVLPHDLATAGGILWRPLLTILSIMITTVAAEQTGTIDIVAARILGPRTTSVFALYRTVFLLSMVTASVLSNDAAILLLTPLVIAFVRARYPAQPRLLLPFGFAVFMAAGVAPFVTSNPMNIVVASAVGLNFNYYAATMFPISIAGSVVSYALLRRLFAADFASAVVNPEVASAPAVFDRSQRAMLVLLVSVAATYPFVAMFDGSAIWMVSAAGAAMALLLTSRVQRRHPIDILRRGVAWDVLIFLPAVFVLAIGLGNAGLTSLLSAWYEGAGIAVVGVTAAVGSAVLNNHPMAFINMMSLAGPSGADPTMFLAALIGGDLGPRLVPTGSLAGLLWIEACRRLGLNVTPSQFIRVGVILTGPALLISLALLALM